MENIGGNKLLDISIILEKARLKDKMKVADLGCGSTGRVVFPAADIVGKRGMVYAVDILKTSLETINRRSKLENYSNIITVWSNLEIFKATKIESEKLDMALLINTLYQSRKRVEIIREAVRMLKRGGELVVVEWKNVSLPFGPPPEERVNVEQLKEAAPRLGLQLENDFFVGPYHFGLIFTKV